MTAIVRHMHFIWGGPPMPSRLRENLTLWRDMHPQWELTLWGQRDLRWLEHRDLFDDAPRLVPPDAVWQIRSDLARYEILLRYGGFYADCDTRPVNPIDEALDGHSIWAAMEDRSFIGNTYLYSEPGEPLMRRIVGGLRASVSANRGKRPNWMTGPRYLTPLWAEFGAYAAPSHLWFPITYMQARRGMHPRIAANVYAVHSFQHVRDLVRAGKR